MQASITINDNCPCQSGKRFRQCCGLFLNQSKKAKTPVQLMRSRFTAFYLGGFGDYLLATWSPDRVQGMSAESLSERTVEWVNLEIVSKSQQGDKGIVEFKAYFKDDGEIAMHHEISNFERVNGCWLYVDGDVRPS